MKKQRSKILLMLPMLLALFSLGCGLSSVLNRNNSAVQIAPTRTPLPTFTPTPPGAGFITIATLATATNVANNTTAASSPAIEAQPVSNDNSTEAATPTATLVVPPTSAIPTDTPTPSGPMVTIEQNMNVRGGPGTNYPVVGSAEPGQASPITGRNDDSSWVQVEYPSKDGKGWVYTRLVKIAGDVNSLPVAAASMAPMPMPTAPSAPPTKQAEAAPAEPEKKFQFTPTGWFASPNGGIVHFKGRIKDEGGNLVNGYSVLLDNWSWKVLSHPAGASHWYPEKGPGEWDVVMPDMNSGQGWWWLSVVRHNCDFMAGFDSQCTNYTQLSDEVKIEVHSPEESIINADWICHWDCDKGIYKNSWTKTDGYGK